MCLECSRKHTHTVTHRLPTFSFYPDHCLQLLFLEIDVDIDARSQIIGDVKLKVFLYVFVFRTEIVERNAMLRTKAMREKEEQRERRKYNYTLLRVRLPDGVLLQGNNSNLDTGELYHRRHSSFV